ncbi:MAG: HPr(Ser) kinase/phosphatase [Erysipelotrichaceae bacterium]|nr:HPr(Ser) kinase/phosphatase [Erysipelotrichaceae bacterium]
MEKIVLVKQIQDYFKYRVISGNEDSLQRRIEVADVNRPGLELTGYFENFQPRRVVILGDKELNYINRVMTEEQQRQSFDFLTGDRTPMILISHDNECPRILKEIAQAKNFPVFASFAPTSSLMVEIVSYLEEQLATSESIHGVLLNVFGIGILIRGESGMGKSEIALELIKHGHILVADDRVDVSRIHNKIMGEAPVLLKDMLEIRGIGVINVVQMFGIVATMPRCDINFVIDLVRWDTSREYTRVGNEEKMFQNYFGIDIPKIELPVREGRSMAELIEAAVTNFILLQRGIDCSKEFEDRVYNFIKNRNEEL